MGGRHPRVVAREVPAQHVVVGHQQADLRDAELVEAGSCHMPTFWSDMPIVYACDAAGAARQSRTARTSRMERAERDTARSERVGEGRVFMVIGRAGEGVEGYEPRTSLIGPRFRGQG